MSVSPKKNVLVKRDMSSLSQSTGHDDNQQLGSVKKMKSPKRNIIVRRKLTSEEEKMPRSPTKSLLPRRDEEGNWIERSLIGEPEDYDIGLQHLEQFDDKIGEKMSDNKKVEPISINEATRNEALDTYRSRVIETANMQRAVAASRGARREQIVTREQVFRKLPVHERISLTREENAIKRWNETQAVWNKFKLRMTKHLGKSIDELIITKSEEYRQIMEIYDLVNKSIPITVKYSSAWYWVMTLRQSRYSQTFTRDVPLGNIFSGICVRIEDNNEIIKEVVRRPHFTSTTETEKVQNMTKSLAKSWQHKMNELRPYQISTESGSKLFVSGINLLEWARNSSNAVFERNDTSNMAEREKISDKGLINSVLQSEEENYTAPPVEGPIIELIYNDSHGNTIDSISSKNVNSKQQTLRTMIEIKSSEEAPIVFIMKNVGPTVLYYEWVPQSLTASKLDVGRPRKVVSTDKHFFLSEMTGSILPNESKVIKILFRSEVAGIFREEWELSSTPSLGTAFPLKIHLRGVSVAVDENSQKRNFLEKRLEKSANENTIKEILNQIVQRVKTPEPILTESEMRALQCDWFQTANPGLYFTPEVFDAFKQLAQEIFQALNFTGDDCIWDTSVYGIQELLIYLIPPPVESEDQENGAENKERESDIFYNDVIKRYEALVEKSKERPLSASMFYPIARQCIMDMVNSIPRLAYDSNEAENKRVEAAKEEAAKTLATLQQQQTGNKKNQPPPVQTPSEIKEPVYEYEHYISNFNELLHGEFLSMINQFVGICTSADLEARMLAMASRNMIISRKANVSEVNINGKIVLLRADLDMSQNVHIFNTDESTGAIISIETLRSEKAIAEVKVKTISSTIIDLIARGAKSIVIFAHNGKPKDSKFTSSLSLKPYASQLSDLLEMSVDFLETIQGPEVDDLFNEIKEQSGGPVSVIMFENLYFNPQERVQEFNEVFDTYNKLSKYLNKEELNSLPPKKNISEDEEESYCKKISSYGDVYVNDCLPSCLTPSATVTGIFKNNGGMRLLSRNVFEILTKCLKLVEFPADPFTAILSGPCNSKTIQLLYGLVQMCDFVLIAGPLSYEFYESRNEKGVRNTASTLDEENKRKAALQFILQVALKRNCKIITPLDYVVIEPSGSDETKECESTIDLGETPLINSKCKIVDIGSKTSSMFDMFIKKSKTLLWNGTLGECSNIDYQSGTNNVIESIRSMGSKLYSVVTDQGTAESVLGMTARDEKVCPISDFLLDDTVFQVLCGNFIPGIASITERDNLPPNN